MRFVVKCTRSDAWFSKWGKRVMDVVAHQRGYAITSSRAAPAREHPSYEPLAVVAHSFDVAAAQSGHDAFASAAAASVAWRGAATTGGGDADRDRAQPSTSASHSARPGGTHASAGVVAPPPPTSGKRARDHGELVPVDDEAREKGAQLQRTQEAPPQTRLARFVTQVSYRCALRDEPSSYNNA